MYELFQSAPILMIIAIAYLLIINLIALLLMYSDKRRAKQPATRRVPEKTLFFSALIGGSIGAIAGMQLFRHKTKHWYFVVGMPAILIIQIGLVALLFI